MMDRYKPYWLEIIREGFDFAFFPPKTMEEAFKVGFEIGLNVAQSCPECHKIMDNIDALDITKEQKELNNKKPPTNE